MSLKNPRDRVKPRDNIRDVFDGFSDSPRSKGDQRRVIFPVLAVCAILAVLVAVFARFEAMGRRPKRPDAAPAEAPATSRRS